RTLQEIEDEQDETEGEEERDREDPVEGPPEERNYFIPATCLSTSCRVTIPTNVPSSRTSAAGVSRERSAVTRSTGAALSMTGKGACMTSETGWSRTFASARARAISGPSLSDPTHSLAS